MECNKLPRVFGVDFMGMSKDTRLYCLYLLHSLGMRWKSGDAYEYSKGLIERFDISGIAVNNIDGDGCAIRFEFGGNPYVMLTLSQIEVCYKKALSAGSVSQVGKGFVDDQFFKITNWGE